MYIYKNKSVWTYIPGEICPYRQSQEVFMKKRLFLTAIPALILVLVCGFLFFACSNGSDDSAGGDPFTEASYGTYNGTGLADGHTIYVTIGGWSIYGPEVTTSGTYTLSNDNKLATLSSGGSAVGTATISGSTLTVNLTSGYYPGTYTGTKQP
jgi:hypothetical protein